MFISLKNKVLNYFQPKITIIFHIYYENEVPNLIERIRRIDKHYDVFITYSKELSAGTMHLLHSISKPIHFLRTENIGMDVYPFLAAMEHFKLFDAGIILKLHTKRGEGEVGQKWRDTLLDGTIGDGIQFNENIKLLQNNHSIKMIGSDATYLSGIEYIKDNTELVEELNSRFLSADMSKDWGFFAGTMFLAQAQIFKPLPKASILKDRFVSGSTTGDGELSHALERLFGLLPRVSGGVSATVPPVKNPEFKIDPSPSKYAISKIMRQV